MSKVITGKQICEDINNLPCDVGAIEFVQASTYTELKEKYEQVAHEFKMLQAGAIRQLKENKDLKAMADAMCEQLKLAHKALNLLGQTTVEAEKKISQYEQFLKEQGK